QQVRQNGFSSSMQTAMSRSADQYSATQNAPQYLGQSETLPPITVAPGSSGAPQQLSLPPITGNVSGSSSGLSSQIAAPVPVQRPQRAPVVKSGGGRAAGGSEIYSQEPLNLPPVTTLP